MRQIVLILFTGLFFSCNTPAQLKRTKTGGCIQIAKIERLDWGFYWMEPIGEHANKDSVTFTAQIRIAGSAVAPPPPFSSVFFNDIRILTDKEGVVHVKLPKGEYVIKANVGGNKYLSTEKLIFSGGGGYGIYFYIRTGYIH